MKFIIFIFTLLCIFSCSTGSDNGDRPLKIFAAASLSSVLPEVGNAFATDHPDAEIQFNFAASSLLAKQIAHGADADIYLSADPDWVDFLQERGLVTEKKVLFGNDLVLVVPTQKAKELSNLDDLKKPTIERIALADWTHVPAGKYARELFEKAGLWQDIRGKCLPALDVRAALTYVERGEADCGIVYRTDAAASRSVRVAIEIPESLQPDISYTATILSMSKHPLAPEFFQFLQAESALTVFTKYGFSKDEIREPLSH